MKLTTSCTTLSLSSLLLMSAAHPLLPGQIERRKPASYSVVAVDGGSTTEGSSPTATITDAVTHTQTVMQTQLSTIVVTESETPTTIVFTVTSPSPVTITDSPPASTMTQIISATPDTTPATTVESPSPLTITITESLPSTTPYDNGQWHTNYYYTVSTSSTELPYTTQSASVWNVDWSWTSSSTELTTTPSATPTYDSGLWHGN